MKLVPPLGPVLLLLRCSITPGLLKGSAGRYYGKVVGAVTRHIVLQSLYVYEAERLGKLKGKL